MKIIFFGSDDFALVNLEKLIEFPSPLSFPQRGEEKSNNPLLLGEGRVRVVACVTQPDKPRGRGMQVTQSVIKDFAVKHKIPILQPEKISDPNFLEELKRLEADLFVVIAYGKILPKEVLSIPKKFCINVHGSLLPKYRGAAPVNWAIINGDSSTGITIIKMNEQMDAGEIISQKEISILPTDTSISLRQKMAQESANLLIQTIAEIEQNKFKLFKQDSAAVTLAPKLSRELGRIDWNKTSREIHNLIRGLLPYPSAYTYINGKMVKILESEILPEDSSKIGGGTIIRIVKDGIVAASSDQALLIKKVHPEAGKSMDAYSFALGHRVEAGNACQR